MAQVSVTVVTNDPNEPGKVGLRVGPETNWWDGQADMASDLVDGVETLPFRLRLLIAVRLRLLADGLNLRTSTANQKRNSIERAPLEVW